jgi:hypothetical protein
MTFYYTCPHCGKKTSEYYQGEDELVICLYCAFTFYPRKYTLEAELFPTENYHPGHA